MYAFDMLRCYNKKTLRIFTCRFRSGPYFSTLSGEKGGLCSPSGCGSCPTETSHFYSPRVCKKQTSFYLPP